MSCILKVAWLPEERKAYKSLDINFSTIGCKLLASRCCKHVEQLQNIELNELEF